MKAHYKTRNGRLMIEIEADGVKKLFHEIAAVQEVFDAETVCGCCNSQNVRFLQRNVEKYAFYEVECCDCRASFSFGQKKEGGALFPKRKDEDGRLLPNRGWSKYVKPGEESAAPAQRPATPAEVAAPQRTPPAATPAPQVQTKTGPDGIELRNGVPVFANWQDAQQSKRWGCGWIWVGGVQYRLTNGNYTEHQQQGARTA